MVHTMVYMGVASIGAFYIYGKLRSFYDSLGLVNGKLFVDDASRYV